MTSFQNLNEAMAFNKFLKETKGLEDRTANCYLFYYKDLSTGNLTQQYINSFIESKKNNPVIRAMMLNFLQFRGLDKQFNLPFKQTGTKKKRVAIMLLKEEVEQLRLYFYEKSLKRGLIFDLIYQGALRRAELISIRVNSFKWKQWLQNVSGLCHLIVLGKGDKEREVLINPETAEAILTEIMKGKHPDELDYVINSESLLFTKRNGEKLIEQDIYNMIKRGSAKALHGKSLNPHSLRHNRATELLKKGLSIKDIQVYLGHSELSTTEIYLHIPEKESIAKIERVLSN